MSPPLTPPGTPPVTAATRSASAISTSAIGCAAATAGCFGASASASGAARPMGWWANRVAANPPPRSPPCAICRATARSPPAASLVDGRNLLALRDTELRQLRANTVSMVYQDPGRALNPSIRVGKQVAEVFRLKGASPADSLRQAAAILRPRADRRSQPGDGPLSPPALRRHAAAGRHRHGDRDQSDLADPGRADHRPRRHGGGGGARPHRAAARRILHLGPVHQPQPRRHRPHVRSRRRALCRDGWWRRGPTSEVFNSPRHPYTVGLLRCLPRRGRRKDHGRLDTIPGFLPAPGAADRRLRLRRALRAGRRSLPPGRAAADRSRRQSSQPLPLSRPRARTCRAPRRPIWPIPIEIDRSHRPILSTAKLTKSFMAGTHRLRALVDISVDLWPGETLGLVGESGSGKTTFAKLLLGLYAPDPEQRDRARRRRLARPHGQARPGAGEGRADRLPESGFGAQPLPSRARIWWAARWRSWRACRGRCARRASWS